MVVVVVLLLLLHLSPKAASDRYGFLDTKQNSMALRKDDLRKSASVPSQKPLKPHITVHANININILYCYALQENIVTIDR